MVELLHAELTERIIGVFRDVYREYGNGFYESVYANSMAIELGAAGLDVKREVVTEVFYKGVVVGWYRADMIIESRVLLEIKATKALSTGDERQLLNYLKASGIKVGLLLNFGPDAQIVRRVLTRRIRN